MQPFNILLTGLSASGKSTLGYRVGEYLTSEKIPNEVLDGDVYRSILSPDAGHTVEERDALRKKILYVAKLLNKHGVSCILPFLSSTHKLREFARQELCNFIEVYVKCPIEVCMERDPKGLYRRARNGQESNIVGIDLPYEEPQNPEVIVETHKMDVDICLNKILTKINELKLAELEMAETG